MSPKTDSNRYLDDIAGSLVLFSCCLHVSENKLPQRTRLSVEATTSEVELAGANAGVEYVKRQIVDETEMENGIIGAGLGFLSYYAKRDRGQLRKMVPSLEKANDISLITDINTKADLRSIFLPIKLA